MWVDWKEDCSGAGTSPAFSPGGFTSLSDRGSYLFQARLLPGFNSTVDCCADKFVFAERSGKVRAFLSIKCGKLYHWWFKYGCRGYQEYGAKVSACAA